MKQVTLFIVALLFTSLKINAQTNTATLKNRSADSILVYRNFSPSQKLAWDSIEQKWQDTIFRPECYAAGFHQDCKVCSDIAWQIILDIDTTGKVSNMTIVLAEILCNEKTPEQKKMLEEKVLNWFKQQTFTSTLRNMRIEVQVGRFTRC